jgi:hypothetical protein
LALNLLGRIQSPPRKRETPLCACSFHREKGHLLESKADSDMDDDKVIAKRDATVKWCKHASAQARTYDGKPWKYVLVPHDVVLENMTLERLAAQFTVS